jgi:hypothetical protein
VRPQVRRRERCPACGALSERRQLVCLGCGERLALEPKRPARPVIAAAGALVAVGAISLLFVAQALIGGGSSPSRHEPVARHAAAAAPGGPSGPDAAQRAMQRRAREQLAAAASGWPATQAGWTVVLLASADRDSAKRFAAALGERGEDAGLISPEERPDLGSLWIVFSGVHPDQASALAATTRLRALGYPNAFTRLIPKAPSNGAPARPPPG